ncbi:MAG: glycosyltransferase family 4 protein [Thermodesulfobacteriota bacterium]
MNVLLIIGSLALGTAGAWFMSRYADTFGLIDRPNERSSHSISTPRGGGVGIVLTLILAGFFLKDHLFVILTCCVGLLGLLEDRFAIPPQIRLLFQLVFAALVVILLSGFPASVVTVILFLFWVVFIVGSANVFNFMDGINGIAGLTGFVGFGLLSLFLSINAHEPDAATMSLALLMGCLGFLPFNLFKARVFMGDVGSIFLGFIFASFVVKLSLSLGTFLCLIMFLSTFYADGLITIAYRWRRGENLMEAHRSHLYQYACNELKIPHWKVSLSYTFVQAVIGILALLAYREGIMWQIALFGLFGVVSLLIYPMVKNIKPCVAQ